MINMLYQTKDNAAAKFPGSRARNIREGVACKLHWKANTRNVLHAQ